MLETSHPQTPKMDLLVSQAASFLVENVANAKDEMMILSHPVLRDLGLERGPWV